VDVNTFLQKIGAWPSSTLTEFVVWAPLRQQVELMFESPSPTLHPMEKDEWGYWRTSVPAPAGTKYFYRLDGKTVCPDPASVSQPNGVHGASEVGNREDFPWEDGAWKGIPLSNMIIYELHTGLASDSQDFEGIIGRLDYLLTLGVNTIELMPLAQFPGERNWGYDGVYPFAVQDSYGGREAFKRLVNAAHAKGIAILVDVVYNHLGPEGNYLREYGPYFTAKYCTPWGDALNFDDEYCDGVRNYFLQNARMWLEEFHVDGLRLDAVHAIRDFSANPFIRQLKEQALEIAHATGCTKELIAEIDLNDSRYIDSPEKGGYGLDGQWCDEFHHALHSLLTGEKNGYYEDFGELTHLESAFRHTYVYTGNYSIHRKRLFGSHVEQIPCSRFVVFAQNHDQVGNRAMGDRLTASLSFEQLKLAAATVLLSPYIPLLFMGEEYGEKNPFLFFTSFTDPALIEGVRKGRREEFGHSDNDVPDPQDLRSFQQCKLSWNYKDEPGATLFRFYQSLIALRKTRPALQAMTRDSILVHPAKGNVLAFERKLLPDHLSILMNFGGEKATLQHEGQHALSLVFNSTDAQWQGSDGSEGWSGPDIPDAAGSAARPRLAEIDPGAAITLSPYSVSVFENHH
jgi:maltooligosyltrehalose trehalohydrolase